MGSFNFYKRVLYEYLIKPGYTLTEYAPGLWDYKPYVDPSCLDYWANQYMNLTP